MKINEEDIRNIVIECVRAIIKEENGNELQDLVVSTMNEIKSFLSDFNLDAKLLKSTYTEWVGQYRSHSVKTGTMRFSINVDKIREWSQELDDDVNAEEEARYQVMVSLWHECGHGLIEHIKYCRKKSNLKKDGKFNRQALKDTRWFLGYEEEDLAEEFGEYMTGLRYDSDLYDFLMKYKGILRYE